MNAGWIYLLCIVAACTALWPIGRWALAGDGHPGVMGFWTSLVTGLMGLIAVVLAREPSPPRGVCIAAILTAIAYAVGFCLLIMRCLKIGPAGPTVTVNNMAMVCGVLYGVVYVHPAGLLRLPLILGVAGACVALLLIGMGQRSPDATRPIPPQWLPMVLAGGAFSGLSFMMQTHVGELHRDNRFFYVACTALLSAFILLPVMLREPARWKRRREALGGVLIGSLSVVSISLTLSTFRYFSAAIVLPVAVTTPVLLMLVIGHFVYRERLSRYQLAGTLIGAMSIALLAVGSA